MDALELLKTRRSISAPFLAAPGPDPAQLAELLTIAARVPDHGKLTPWRFIVFEGEARTAAGDAAAEVYRVRHPSADEKAVADQRSKLAHAPLVVGVVSTAAPHPKIPEWEQLLSAGNAAMLLVLAAHAMGFAAQWTTGWMAYDAEAGRVLGLGSGERLVAFVHIGTPTVPPVDRPRPELDRIVTRWHANGADRQ